MVSYFNAVQIIPSSYIASLTGTLEGKLVIIHIPMTIIISEISSCIYRYLG